MNTLLNRDELDDSHGPASNGKDREITLGTGMVLGIFFALAVLCAGFFGFGYSLGSKRVAAVATAPQEVTAANPTFSGFKPPPGSPAGSSAGLASSRPLVPSSAAELAPPAAKQPASSRLALGSSAVAKPTATPILPASVIAATPAPAAGSAQAVVQIAAVSHQEDADLLVSTLKRRGYNVVIHTEPQDKLLHVQVGPFASRKDADAMRQRLLADGFNAIVK